MSSEEDLLWFLKIRIKEDEAAAQELGDGGWVKGGFNAVVGRAGDLKLAYADRVRPSRFLAEVEAKRRIVDELTGDYGDGIREARVVLRLLAAGYADHGDYREEWRP